MRIKMWSEHANGNWYGTIEFTYVAQDKEGQDRYQTFRANGFVKNNGAETAVLKKSLVTELFSRSLPYLMAELFDFVDRGVIFPEADRKIYEIRPWSWRIE